MPIIKKMMEVDADYLLNELQTMRDRGYTIDKNSSIAGHSWASPVLSIAIRKGGVERGLIPRRVLIAGGPGSAIGEWDLPKGVGPGIVNNPEDRIATHSMSFMLLNGLIEGAENKIMHRDDPHGGRWGASLFVEYFSTQDASSCSK